MAWALLATFAASVAALVVLSVANGNFQRQSLADTVGLLLAFAAFMGVGALIVANRPGNAIGWVFSAIALLAVTGAMAQEYAGYASVARPGSLPGTVFAGWYAAWTWYPAVALVLVFTPLLFPDGRPPSPRWRPVALLAAAGTAVFTVLAALQPTIQLTDDQVADNPIGVAAVGNPEDSIAGLVLGVVLVVAGMAAVASLVMRFRRSRGDERLQLKWFTSAAALLPVVVLGDLLPQAASSVVFAVGISLLPVAAGIAILRYRLYDIDRLINRTLVYGLLTVLLGAVYAGLVLVGGLLSAAWPTAPRAGRLPEPPWPWPRCPSRPGAASSGWSTGGSTGGATTPPGRWRRSAPGCATRPTWAACRRSSWRWSTRPCSRPPRRCGYGQAGASRRPGRR